MKQVYTWRLFYAVGFCSHLQQEQEKKRCEVENLVGKIASLQAQNKKLLLEKNNFMADNKILEAEMEMTQKTNRSYHILIFLRRYTYIYKNNSRNISKNIVWYPRVCNFYLLQKEHVS